MKRAVICSVAAISLLLAACSGGNASGATEPAETTELTVFAASSLAAVFEDEIGPAFEADNPGTTVTFNFSSSDVLAAQIQSEGTADVFASASGTWMDAVQDDPGVTDRADFVKNRLVIVTPPDNPAGIESIQDLAGNGVQLVLAAEGVPVGDYAREALGNAGILKQAEANVASNEEDNASVVAKVVAGEADAAIVYASDVSAAAGNDLNAVEIPEDINVIATYPIAVVDGSTNSDLAASFVAAVTGPDGQTALETYGFEPVS